jgi:4-amino-4-deoxy-L-arabinose transferase-like glycosyltransferase
MQSRTGWLIGILLLAFVLRFVAALTIQWRLDHVWKRQFLLDGDARGYMMLAERIAKGESYEIYTPPRQVLRMPGFPAFLALVMTVWSRDMLPLRFALCGVGTIACGLVYWLGRDVVNAETGLTAAALTAVSPVMVGFAPLILSETMFAATLVASLIPLARLFQRHFAASRDAAPVSGNCAALAAGVLIGVACYVRPSWLLAAPMYAALLVAVSGQRGRALLHGALLLVGLFVCLLPWGIRNQRVTGHFVLTTLWAGPSLYDGLHREATGESDMAFFDRDNLMSRMSEYDVNRHYNEAAWQFVRENPGRAIELGFIKLWRFWKPWPGAAEFDHWSAKVAVAIWFIPLVIFSGYGAYLLRRNWPALLLCAGPILYFSALHTVFVSSLRYRLPAEYPLAVIAAAGVLACLSRRRVSAET